MGQAIYNALGVDDKPVIEPYPSGGGFNYLSFGCVKTTVGAARIARRVYGFPGLSGLGSERCGLRAQPIDWELTVVALSGADLRSFLTLFGQYAIGEGRYVLLSELGETWPYVELVGVEPIEELLLPGGTEIWWHGRVRWENVQPEAPA